MPFLRGGYTEDGGSLLQKSISTGVGYQWVPGRDVLGPRPQLGTAERDHLG